MGRRYRQLFLFVAVLIVPAIMIAVQARTVAIQERELSKKRFEELVKRTAADIGQDIFTRLERIKQQEMANMPAPSVTTLKYSNPAVAAVGWVEGDRLVWPWDVRSSRDLVVADDPLRDARRAEFGDHNFNQAAALYRKVKDESRNDHERFWAALGLARVLALSGKQSESENLCRDLLKTPSAAADDDGLSLWSSAAAPCVEWGAAPIVLERITLDLESPSLWPTIQIYRFRTILETLLNSGESAIHEGARSALESVAARVRTLEQAQKLQKNFSILRTAPAEWQPFEGEELWLVGQAPGGTTARRLVVAVRWQTILGNIQADRLSRNAAPRFQAMFGGKGESPSEFIPALRIAFPDGVADTASGAVGQRSLWTMAFVFVALCTVLGAYLLWRDVRRESHIAELRTQFVSSVSHELKTPLTSIRMFAELLQMKESADPEQSVFLTTIVSESERLTRLLNNVLDFSRIERGQKTYSLEAGALSDVVDAAVRTIQYPLCQQGFSLDLNVAEGIPPIEMDRDALQQAILNLLTNAMKYSGQSREIGLHVNVERGCALIDVSDHGIGISKKEQVRIFEKFYRAPIPENREISGTGLGLALVSHIAAAHRGSVHVTSSPGRGSTFTLRLPLILAERGVNLQVEVRA
jgi:two-component system phosphate regulon sensor histidine kinase PhoR